VQYGPSDNATQTADTNTTTEQPSLQTSPQASPQTSPDTGTTATTTSQTAIERILGKFQDSDSLLPNALLLGGVLLMVILMFRMLRKNHKANARRANKQPSPSKRIADIHTQAQSSMEPARKVMVDAEEMARRLGATLDNKAARLELLIEEADLKLNALNRTLAGSPPSTNPTPPPTPPTPPTQPTRSIDPTLLDRARIEQDQEERQTRVAGRIDPVAPEPKPEQPAPPPPQQVSIQDQIAELAASGIPNAQIAQQLNYPIGQVELILNLRKQQG
jgi:DNA-binding NarL/FixJ family response regulator